MQSRNIETIANDLLALREQKAKLEQWYKENASKLEAAKESLEGEIYRAFDLAGVTSAKVSGHHFSINTKEINTVADWDTFYKFTVDKLKETDDPSWLALFQKRLSQAEADRLIGKENFEPAGLAVLSEPVLTIRKGK